MILELAKNAVFTAVMDGYSSEGAGVCRAEGRAVFVPGALEGEEWRVRVVGSSSGVLWGRGEACLRRSENRAEPDCAAYPRCGGCALRHMTYAEELRLKLRRVNDALRRIGGLDFAVGEILPAEADAFQRRKAIFNVGLQNGAPAAGFYRARSHEIVAAPDCPAVLPEARRAAAAVLDWMAGRGFPAYDEETGQGGVRHIFTRTSRLTGGTVVTLVSSLPLSAGDGQALAELLRQRCPDVTGLVLDLNRERGNVVLAGEFSTLWGAPVLTEELCGLRFELSPRSFFQVNPAQAEKLYRRAVEYAGVTAGMPALDLYCGTGTIGLCLAAAGARVVGAETGPEAVENAGRNAARNGLAETAEFLCMDAGEAARTLAERGLRPEAIVVDPPRKGLAPEVIGTVGSMAPRRVVYVSCDPGTLARDLALFAERGFRPEAGCAVDMFPRTAHVETVVLLSRGQV